MKAYRSFVAVIAVASLAACGGGNGSGNAGASTGAAAPGASTAAAPAAGASTGAAAAAGTAKPVTGKTWDVKMVGDAQGYRYEPAALTIKQGDGVRWTVVSAIPHNVTFWADSIPQGAQSQLQANMGQTMGQLTGVLLNNVSDTYQVSFAGVPAGVYKYYCTPHLPMGMKGSITVQ